MRRLAELLSRRIVFRRRLPDAFGGGKMYISPAARLQYWKPNIYYLERSLFDAAALLVRSGDVVWDAGANAGVFSVAAAGMAGATGRVLAFEADTWLVNLVMRTSQALNSNYAPLDVVNVAVADKHGFADFAIAARSRAANYLVKAGGSTQSGGVRMTYRVMTVGLDDMLAISERPNVIKVDIEGAELIVFSNAPRILKECRPRILCEVNIKNSRPIAELFRRSRYALFDYDNLSHGLNRTDVASRNTLFLPEEDSLIAKLQKPQEKADR